MIVCEKFQPRLHSLDELAVLLYETEPWASRWLFGWNREKALQKIKTFIETPRNYFSYENAWVVVREGHLAGAIVCFAHGETSEIRDATIFLKTASVIDFLRVLFIVMPVFEYTMTFHLRKGELYIGILNVLNAYQHQGIGSALMSKSLELAKEKKCRRILLEVQQTNKPAIALYEKCGFTIVRKRTIPFIPIISTYTMELAIPQ